MAEPATQSPFISSSAGGGSLEPAGRDLKGAGSPQPCADSFVSSSQPVSLFSTSQENQGETNGKSILSNVGKELVDGQRWNRIGGTSEDSGIEVTSVEPPSPETSGCKGHSYDPVVQAGFLGPHDSDPEVPFDGKTQLSGYDQAPKPASGGESRFALLTSLKEEPKPLPARAAGSASPAVPGEAVVDKDSPESPFEVIADKLELDKEFKELAVSTSGDISSNWVMHGERELLTDIPEDSVCEFRAKPRSGGRVLAGPGLARQSSGTSAALEEVSKCVREMHSFTSELMNWDLIPKDLDKLNDFVASDQPVSPTKTTGLTGSKVEAGKTSTPLTISVHPKGRVPLEVEEKRAKVTQEATTVKAIPPAAVELKADVRWPNHGQPETTDADSSGESDDTVIEDATVELTFQTDPKAVQNSKMLPRAAPPAPIKSELKTGGNASDKPWKPTQDVRMAAKAPETNWGFTDEFETVQAKSDVLGGSLETLPQLSKRTTPDAPTKTQQEFGSGEQDFPGKLPLGSSKEATCPDALKDETPMDFMKEVMKSKGSESPEDPVETFSEAELRAARSEVAALHSQQPPKAAQDFEQEHLTIKALKEVGQKAAAAAERQLPTLSKVSLPGGRRPGQYGEMPPDTLMPAQKSALEKRPLCLEQAVDVKLASASAGFGAQEIPYESLRGHPPPPPPPAENPIPRALMNLPAQFSVRNLIFWRDVKKTGLVFSTTLILLLSLAAFSVISVVSYLILALLSVTISFRVYKSVIQAVQKSEDGHPFKAYLDQEVALSSETFHNYVSAAMVHVNHALKLIMRLFLVEDLVDSLKLAVVMWLMTYVGAIFNGITLLILAELLVFSVPVVYEKYKTQIDHYVGIARDQINSVVSKVQAKVPGVVKKKAE